tara:strand:+ start:1752 stop:2426 length:675 start_codon:yes stop_codon:yes gene_type:complete
LLAIIQSRYDSIRLPGKALLPLGDSSILGKCIDRVSKASQVTKILIATSNEDSDRLIVKYCKDRDLSYHLGSLHDVGLRLAEAAAATNHNKFIRICGDSPFIDPLIIDQAISLSNSSDFDLVTNVFPRSFPKGQSVEVIKTKMMLKISTMHRSKEEKEHVTSYFYKNHYRYRICAFSSGLAKAESRQCIDNEKDYRIAKNVMSLMGANDLGWEEIQTLWDTDKN